MESLDNLNKMVLLDHIKITIGKICSDFIKDNMFELLDSVTFSKLNYVLNYYMNQIRDITRINYQLITDYSDIYNWKIHLYICEYGFIGGIIKMNVNFVDDYQLKSTPDYLAITKDIING